MHNIRCHYSLIHEIIQSTHRKGLLFSSYSAKFIFLTTEADFITKFFQSLSALNLFLKSTNFLIRWQWPLTDVMHFKIKKNLIILMCEFLTWTDRSKKNNCCLWTKAHVCKKKLCLTVVLKHSCLFMLKIFTGISCCVLFLNDAIFLIRRAVFTLSLSFHSLVSSFISLNDMV